MVDLRGQLHGNDYASGPEEVVVASIPVGAARPDRRGSARRIVYRPEFGVFLALAMCESAFGALSSHFFTVPEWGNIMAVAALDGIPAVAVTFLMISGEFDLSIGTVFALSPMLFTYLVINSHWQPELALVVGMLAAGAVGLCNAAVTVWAGVPSFITTLGMFMILTGVEVTFNGGNPLALNTTSPGVSTIATVLAGALGGNDSFFSMLVPWFVVSVIAGAWVLRSTRFGNWVLAAGGNAESARSVGVPVRRVKTLNFVACSLTAGIAGIMQVAYIQQWAPTQGETLQLTAILIAVVGGASLFGGSGSAIGTGLGAILVASLASGLVVVGAPGSWYTSFIGLILIASVVINIKTGKLVGGRRRRLFR